MTATLLRILWLPFELMWYLFGCHTYTCACDASKAPAAISSSSTSTSCSSTDSSASDYDIDGDWTTQDELVCSHAILEQISQALQNPSRTLTLTNLVELAEDKRDAMAVVELLQDQQRWHSVHLQDTVCASNYRRWNYKKSGFYSPILQQAKQIPVNCTTTVTIDTQAMTPTAILSLLQSLQCDIDVKSIAIHGKIHYKHAEAIALALVSLLSHDKRTWKNLQWRVQLTTDQQYNANEQEQREANLVQRVCKKAIQNIAQEKYISFNTGA